MPILKNSVLKRGEAVVRRLIRNGVTAYQLFNPALSTIAVGANAAYSIRTVGDFANLCLRVRRSSDDTEQDIGFVNGLLDTSSLLLFVGAGDGFVSVFYDQSGNNMDLLQTVLVKQPKLVDAGTVITQNSLPTLLFDGVDDVMISATTLPTPSDIAFIFGVWRKENLNNSPTNWNLNSPSAGGVGRFSSHAPFSDGVIYFDAGSSTAGRLAAGGLNSIANHQYTLIKMPIVNGQQIRRDGVLHGQRTPGLGAVGFGQISIGDFNSTPIQQGTVRSQELIIYLTNQRSAINKIENSQKTYFGTP